MNAVLAGFPEDSYGSVKRLAVFWEWAQPLRARRAGPLSILDFGCGTGRGVSVPLAAAGDTVHGVDAHAPSIEYARRAHGRPNLTFGAETIEDLERRSARFDVVICSEVLEHLADPGACLRGLRAVLADDGLLFVTVPNGLGAFEILTRVKRRLDRVGVNQVLDGALGLAQKAYRRIRGRVPSAARDDSPFFDDGGHVQFFRLRRLERLFTEGGWDVVARRGRVVVCGPYADFWISRLSLCRLNGAIADHLPLALSADWMFCARPQPEAVGLER